VQYHWGDGWQQIADCPNRRSGTDGSLGPRPIPWPDRGVEPDRENADEKTRYIEGAIWTPVRFNRVSTGDWPRLRSYTSFVTGSTTPLKNSRISGSARATTIRRTESTCTPWRAG
jgi:hypothetical protein